MNSFPIDEVRAQFPALAQTDNGRARIYFDGPGGTQICRQAIVRMVAQMERGTANSGGVFASSVETDDVSAQAHEAMADLLGAQPGEIAFGPNMTSLTLSLSRALAQSWQPGDQVIVSRLDHDANVSPWLLAARDRGAEIRWLDMDESSGTLRIDGLQGLLSDRTRLVAVGAASNALGTTNDVAAISSIVRAHSTAILFVDAVQSVPHLATDVTALGCDLLACSPYKFFGPHQGVLWGKAELLDGLTAYKVRPASSHPPAVRFETGTPSFEGQAGVLGTIKYLEWLGRRVSPSEPVDRRAALIAAMESCAAYERWLGTRFLSALSRMPGVRLYGPPGMEGRVPTFGFTIEGHSPDEAVAFFAERGIFAWAGSFYAVEPIGRLGLADSGGLIRVGLNHYNTAEEVDFLIGALQELIAGGS